MKTTIAKLFVAAGIVTCLTALTQVAEARKPRVCENWLPYATTRTDVKDAPKVVVCFDNEAKPYMMVGASFVSTKDKDGNTATLAIEAR